MGTCSFTPYHYTKRFDGSIEVSGITNLSNSYSTGGDTLDLSKYFASTSTVIVMISRLFGGATTHVYHNKGNASDGKLIVEELYVGVTVAEDHSTSVTITSTEESAGTDLSSRQCNIIAIGRL